MVTNFLLVRPTPEINRNAQANSTKPNGYTESFNQRHPHLVKAPTISTHRLFLKRRQRFFKGGADQRVDRR